MTAVAQTPAEYSLTLGVDLTPEGEFPGTPTFACAVDLGVTQAQHSTSLVTDSRGTTPLIGRRLVQVVRALERQILLLRGPASTPHGAGGSSLADSVRGPRSSTRLLAADVLDAVLKCSEWLKCTEEDVAADAGFSRRSIANWRKGIDVNPSTVRGLLELHAVLSLIARTQGDQITQYLEQAPPGTQSPRREELK